MPSVKSVMKTTTDYWAKKLGLDQDAETPQKRRTLREASKKKRQERYGKRLGHKAVRSQRRKSRQLKEAYGGD